MMDLKRFVCAFCKAKNAGYARQGQPFGLSESLLRKCHTKHKSHPIGVALVLGGLEEIRTLDPHNANVMRSQLRYRPKRITRHIIITFPRPVKDIFTGKQGTPRDGRVAWAQKKEMLPPWSTSPYLPGVR